MGILSKRPRLVGEFIRKRREELGISQRSLGLLFDPAVTTQFISNVERGVTPLPPSHVPTLTRALKINEYDLMALLEKEYTLKLSERLGKLDPVAAAPAPATHGENPGLVIQITDYEFMKKLYDAYKRADQKTKQAFEVAAENVLNLPIKSGK